MVSFYKIIRDQLLKVKFAVNRQLNCQILLGILTGEATLCTGNATLLFSPLVAVGVNS